MLLLVSFATGQSIETEWYSETETNGIIIQNSYPKGGPYPGPTEKNFNHSYLVFFTRVTNTTESPLEFTIDFTADSIAIPNSPNTFVKLFLPPDVMTMEKRPMFSYGFTELTSFDEPTSFQCRLNPEEDVLFYVIAFFYQTNAEAGLESRGGNRAELVMREHGLYYNMPPQVDNIPCGSIILDQ